MTLQNYVNTELNKTDGFKNRMLSTNAILFQKIIKKYRIFKKKNSLKNTLYMQTTPDEGL